MLKLNYFKITRFLIYFNFLFPTFNSVFSDADFGVGPLFIHFILTFVCLLCIFLRNPPISKPIKMGLLFFYLFFIIISSSTLFTPNRIIIRDLFELHRPFYYGSAFILPLTLHWEKDGISRYIIKPIFICFIFLLVLGLSTLLSSDVIELVLGLYTKSGNVRTGRASGTFTNPYDYGFMMTFAVNLFLNSALVCKQAAKKIVFGSLSLLSALVILMSQSRTAMIVFAFSLLYFMVVTIFLNNDVKKALKSFVIYVSGLLIGLLNVDRILAYVEHNYRYLYYGISGLLTRGIEGTGSSATRFRQLEFAWDALASRPLIGNGPSKDVAEFMEMQYSLYMYRYGIPGMLIVLLYIVYSFIVSLKALVKINKYTENARTKSFFVSMHVWCAILPVAFWGNPFIDMPRISFFFFFMMGLLTALLRQDMN